eukprot:15440552-Alexandrium_andersonii.AAC.1
MTPTGSGAARHRAAQGGAEWHNLTAATSRLAEKGREVHHCTQKRALTGCGEGARWRSRARAHVCACAWKRVC